MGVECNEQEVERRRREAYWAGDRLSRKQQEEKRL